MEHLPMFDGFIEVEGHKIDYKWYMMERGGFRLEPGPFAFAKGTPQYKEAAQKLQRLYEDTLRDWGRTDNN